MRDSCRCQITAERVGPPALASCRLLFAGWANRMQVGRALWQFRSIHRANQVFQGKTVAEQLSQRHAVYVGSFDPLTLGHKDIIRRGAAIFDRLTVGIGINPDKQPLFTSDERVDLTGQVLAPLENVDVTCFTGLAVNFVKQQGAAVMLRGVRTLTDIEAEFTMSLANQTLAPDIETVFLMSSEKFTHISSSLIKQIAQLGQDNNAEQLRAFVPEEIIRPLIEKFRR